MEEVDETVAMAWYEHVMGVGLTDETKEKAVLEYMRKMYIKVRMLGLSGFNA